MQQLQWIHIILLIQKVNKKWFAIIIKYWTQHMSLSFRNRISLPSIQNKSIINKSTIPIRALRPSLFLNEIDLIPENFKTEAEENITSRI